MSLILTEEQALLKETAAEFLQEKAPVPHLRELRDRQDETGFSRSLWKEMSELGWAGILLPEEFGGSGGRLPFSGLRSGHGDQPSGPHDLGRLEGLGPSPVAGGWDGGSARRGAIPDLYCL